MPPEINFVLGFTLGNICKGTAYGATGILPIPPVSLRAMVCEMAGKDRINRTSSECFS